MGEYDFKIDPETRDLILQGDDFETLEGAELTVQSVQLTVNARKGEFLLDETHGMDFERILEKNRREVTDQDVQNVVRDAILQEPEISLLNTITASYEGRTITAKFRAVLSDGTEIQTEV